MDLEKFQKLDTQILGVSGDSLETHHRFSGKHGITFPMISDEAKYVRGVYGLSRITYIIDKAGIIRFIQEGVPENGELLRELEKLNTQM
ncbi:MAG: redoxin domain-containing protein [Nitrospira sp.]|nr:redoxin domain-containing protein [bacterium]MBL7049871.1 redoxin domain-containing protein [Nitrospira sp.]